MRSLGPYDIERELGRGGMGAVFLARHRPTGVLRAVKVLDSPAPEPIARFEREVQALARAAPRDVVAIHEMGREGRSFYYSMDHMAGGSLRDRIRARGRFGKEAVRLVAGLAAALGRCHARGLIHRDVKPENILFDQQDHARLADFGMVRDLYASRLTATGEIVGTPAYMAPEQLAGQPADGRADVFSLGVILYELVTGQRPYDATELVGLHKQMASGTYRPASAVADTPVELDAILARALATKPAARYDAATFAKDLDAFAKGEKVGDGGYRVGPVVAAGVVLLALAVAVALAVGRASEPNVVAPPPPPPPPLVIAPLPVTITALAASGARDAELEVQTARFLDRVELDDLAAPEALEAAAALRERLPRSRAACSLHGLALLASGRIAQREEAVALLESGVNTGVARRCRAAVAIIRRLGHDGMPSAAEVKTTIDRELLPAFDGLGRDVPRPFWTTLVAPIVSRTVEFTVEAQQSTGRFKIHLPWMESIAALATYSDMLEATVGAFHQGRPAPARHLALARSIEETQPLIAMALLHRDLINGKRYNKSLSLGEAEDLQYQVDKIAMAHLVVPDAQLRNAMERLQTSALHQRALIINEDYPRERRLAKNLVHKAATRATAEHRSEPLKEAAKLYCEIRAGLLKDELENVHVSAEDPLVGAVVQATDKGDFKGAHEMLKRLVDPPDAPYDPLAPKRPELEIRRLRDAAFYIAAAKQRAGKD